MYNIGYHIVWSTKYRRPALVGAVAERLRAILRTIATDVGMQIRSLEVLPDHVHLFVSAHPKHAPGALVKKCKGLSGRQLLVEFPTLRQMFRRHHLWNPSTYYGTVGDMTRDTVERYIALQRSPRVPD